MKRWLWLFVFIFGISTFCYAPSGPARRVANITVKEEDGTPSVSGVRVIEFSNGSVTDNADNTVTVSTGANHTLDGSAHTDVASMTEAAGDVLYHNGTNWTNLAKGDDGEVLELSGGVPVWGTDDTAGAPAWDTIGNPTGDSSITMTEHGTDFLYDTPATAAADDYYLLSLDYDATTDSGEQNILTVRQIDGGTDATGTPDALLLIESTETTADDGPAAGIEVRATTAGTMPIAIDLTDATIGTAIALGANDITTSGGTITQAELDILQDGSITSDEITDNTIANADMADNSIDSDDYVDGSIDLAHMSSASVDSDNIVDGDIDQVDINDTDTLAANPTLPDDSVWFATTGLIFEGPTGAAAIEGLLTVPALSGSDKTWNLPNATGTIVVADDANVSAAEAGFLDGVGAAIVDTGDAVNTAITGTGALDAGSITSNFGAIDNGASNITTTGDISGGGILATGDTAAGDNSAIGYTATEGGIFTGQGSTNDVTIKNDADATVIAIPTGTTITALTSEIKMTERADHESTPGAGFGYLWTKNTAPSTLIFTDDDGTDTTLGSGGGGEWTDTGTVVHPTETGDDVSLGSATLINSSKFSIDGDADQVQVTVQANATQTDSVVIIENSGGTEVVNIDNDGTILTAVGLDAIGAVDMDYGSADVTDHTFLTDGGVVTVLNDNTNTVALSMSGDRIFHDTNADGVKDGGEEFIDLGAGGSTAFDDIGDPDNNAESEIIFDNASETATFTWTGAFADIDAFLIQSETGNPTDGVLLTVIAHDTDVEAAEFGDNTNLTRIGSTGAISQAGTATLTLQDGSDLIITANDNAGPLLSATQSDTMVGTLTADGLTLGANENITLGAQTLDHDGTNFVMNDSLAVTDTEAYTAAAWTGDTTVPTKDLIHDKLEAWNTGKVILLPNDALLPTANFPDLARHQSSGTENAEVWVLDFADAAEEDCYWTLQIPDDYASAPVLEVYWMATAATTGNCRWTVNVMSITDDATNDDMDSKAMASDNTVDSATASVAGEISQEAITLTSADSIAANDLCVIRLSREGNHANDTMGEAIQLVMAVFEYTRADS